MEKLKKSIVIPLDGSKNSLKSLDYLDLMYGHEHDMDISLFYVMPLLPPILTDDKSMDKKIRAKLVAVKKKNKEMADCILSEAREVLINKGFDENMIKTLCRQSEISVAHDIHRWTAIKRKDAILITKRGRTDYKSFFMGAVSGRLVEYCKDCPLWIVESRVRHRKALICVDSSDNSIRAVDHAGFMLSKTDCMITLFHTMRHLRSFIPMEALEQAPDLEAFWKKKEAGHIAPHIKKARQILLDYGIDEDRITTKVANGTRSAANDILKEARKNDFGTIVLGRRGLTGLKDFIMGSVTTKVLQDSSGLAIWIVQ